MQWIEKKGVIYSLTDIHLLSVGSVPQKKREGVEGKKHKIKQTVSEAGRQKDHSATQTVISPLDSQRDLCKWPNRPNQDLLRCHHTFRKAMKHCAFGVCLVCESTACRMAVVTGLSWQRQDIDKHWWTQTCTLTRIHTHTHMHTPPFQPAGMFICQWQLTDRWKSLKVHWFVMRV